MSGEKRSYVQIGVLWENEYQGQKTLKGKLGDADVYIFENDFRNSDRHPTHRICVATPRRKDEDGEPLRCCAPLVRRDGLMTTAPRSSTIWLLRCWGRWWTDDRWAQEGQDDV